MTKFSELNETEKRGDGTRMLETRRVNDAGLERQCRDEADARRRHQPLARWIDA